MKIYVTNETTSDITILGLPHGGVIPASGNRTFTINESVLNGFDGSRVNLAATLTELRDDGDITFQIYAEDGELSSRLFCADRTVAFDDADVDVAALTATINISPAALPTNAIITGCRVDLTEVFDDGALATVSAVTMSLGHGTTVNSILAASDVLTAVTTYVNAAPLNIAPTAGDYIIAKFTATGANMGTLTTGSARVRVFYVLV